MNTDHAVVTSSELEQLHNLWSIAGNFHYTNSSDTLRRYTQALSSLFGAKNTAWIAACHGETPCDLYSIRIFNGWWAMDVIDFNETFDRKQSATIYLELSKKHGPGIDTTSIIETAGKTRVHLRQDHIPDHEHDDFWKTKHYHVPILGIKERIHSVYTISPTAESYFLIDRAPDMPPFTEHDRTLAHLAIAGSANLHRRLFIERGLTTPSSHPLSPREKQTFPLLFTDLTQKEIADKLSVTPNTASQYINSICQKFKARGRNGLIAACA